MENNGSKPVRVGDTIKINWTKAEIKKYGILTDKQAQEYYEKGASKLTKASQNKK